MGLFCCKTSEWVGFHPDFRGFGGCETYIAKKFRQKKARVMCLPFMQWTHRFPRIGERPDKPDDRDKCRNYLIGYMDLGEPIDEICEQFNITKEDAYSIAATASSLEPAPYPASMHVGNSNRLIGIVGCTKWGPMKMRGMALHREFGFRIVKANELTKSTIDWDTLIAIKELSPVVRQHCQQLILDPNDVFFASAGKWRRAYEYWKDVSRYAKPDILIATSPACKQTMEEAFPRTKIVMIPHPCDNDLRGNRNGAGPIVYTGQGCFIHERVEDIKKACKAIGKELVTGLHQKLLANASMCLALRLPPYSNDLNGRCKPQVKLENAAKIGLPVLATNDPAITTLRPEVITTHPKFTVSSLTRKLLETMHAEPLANPYTETMYLDAMQELLYG
jgi:hypothetical protein